MSVQAKLTGIRHIPSDRRPSNDLISYGINVASLIQTRFNYTGYDCEIMAKTGLMVWGYDKKGNSLEVTFHENGDGEITRRSIDGPNTSTGPLNYEDLISSLQRLKP